MFRKLPVAAVLVVLAVGSGVSAADIHRWSTSGDAEDRRPASRLPARDHEELRGTQGRETDQREAGRAIGDCRVIAASDLSEPVCKRKTGKRREGGMGRRPTRLYSADQEQTASTYRLSSFLMGRSS